MIVFVYKTNSWFTMMDPPHRSRKHSKREHQWALSFLMALLMISLFCNFTISLDRRFFRNESQLEFRRQQDSYHEKKIARLWLVVCETRTDNPNFQTWLRSAFFVQNKSIVWPWNSFADDHNGQLILDDVMVTNICYQKKYENLEQNR